MANVSNLKILKLMYLHGNNLFVLCNSINHLVKYKNHIFYYTPVCEIIFTDGSQITHEMFTGRRLNKAGSL